MEHKPYDNCITLDGRMDEPIWETVQEHSGLKTFKGQGSKPIPVQTTFRILPFADRIFIGVKCMEPDMETVKQNYIYRSIWTSDALELFLSPSGNSFEFYQFVVSVGNQTACNYFSEGGQIQPDPYAPEWKSAVYHGEDHWSVEVEIPLVAFYMTSDTVWNSNWRVNVCRDRFDYKNGGCKYYTWSEQDSNYKQSTKYRFLDGFPMRPACDEVRMVQAAVEIAEEKDGAYYGTMLVKTENPEKAAFTFTSDVTEPVTLTLEVGANEFTLPCRFEKTGRQKIAMQLERQSDGLVFKRWYPVRIEYEAIRLQLTLPEYRNNFYPGQDYSKVVGKVTAVKPVTLKLEGPGIPTTELTPDADGNFCFATPDFEVGEAWLTATIDGYELKKKIRRLAPTGRQMTWISGGNLIVDGEPVLRRSMYARYYRGGEAFKRRYDADNLHETLHINGNDGNLAPDSLLHKKGISVEETKRDAMPRELVFDNVDAILEENKDKDFAYYYLSDEPECRGLSPVYLKYLYEYIADKDPYHVILMASRAGDRFHICADWIESHPYISPQQNEERGRYYGTPIAKVGRYIECLAKLNMPDKCIGFLPTCFAYKWSNAYADYPTFAEYVCHTWAAMIAGAKTIWPYAYHDLNDRASLYEGTRYIFSSFEALEKIVLFGKRTELVKTREVHAVRYDMGEEKMFALVNFTSEPQTVTLEGISGTWHEFRRNRMITGNTFELKPFEVIVGTSEVKDAGLPTYEEVDELVNKLEYERTHRGSLLFDRYQDIDVTASRDSSKYKLFDGILDNHGWDCVGQMDKFYELNLTKVQPTFSKVVVHGYPADSMEIKVRNGGELSDPEIAEIQTEEFSKTFILKNAITPEALRIESKAERIELYEIEAF